MLKLLRSIALILTPKERRRGLLVLAMSILLGLLETAGVASVMPFLAVAGNPQSIEKFEPLAWAYARFGFSSPKAFLMALGIFAICVLALTIGFKVLTNWAQLRFVSMRRHSLSRRLLQTFLDQPYVFFLNRNSADLAKGILSEANEVVSQVLKPGVEMISSAIVALILIAFLIYVDPRVALAAGAAMGGSYLLVFLIIRDSTLRRGRERAAANRIRFKIVNEAFGGIKEVKLKALEPYYLHSFDDPSRVYARTQASNAIVSQVPRHFIEMLAFGSVIAITIYLLHAQGEIGNVLPVLGAYALAGYRLMPALQNVYAGVVTLRFGRGALEVVARDLKQAGMPARRDDSRAERLQLRESIMLDGVSYCYPGAERPALIDLRLEIKANTTVGFAGRTGAGKTTAADLILGLLLPTSGCVRVDGQPLDADLLPRWQRQLGYVPQVIYLSDESIAENIALGVPAEKIDRTAVEQAARAAQLHDFILTLPQGYDTLVGERGVRLSGGQRQRIGIARALYGDPAVLVMDEGTSALDNATEAAVMEAVHGLAGRKTIILIAHRLSTLKGCDQVFHLEGGRLCGQGALEELRIDTNGLDGLYARTGAESRGERDQGETVEKAPSKELGR